jgi:hypothetical protein
MATQLREYLESRVRTDDMALSSALECVARSPSCRSDEENVQTQSKRENRGSCGWICFKYVAVEVQSPCAPGGVLERTVASFPRLQETSPLMLCPIRVIFRQDYLRIGRAAVRFVCGYAPIAGLPGIPVFKAQTRAAYDHLVVVFVVIDNNSSMHGMTAYLLVEHQDR